MDPAIKAAYEAALKGQSCAFATIVDSTVQGTPRKAGAKMAVLKDGSLFGTIGGGPCEQEISAHCLQAIRDNKPRIVKYDFSGRKGASLCGGSVKVFIEPFQGQRKLIICGAGHIALPLSVLGKILNFFVIIIDDRPELANEKRFPHVDQILCGNHQKKISKVSVTENSFAVILTQDHEKDFACLRELVNSLACYVGVIASQAKKQKFMAALREAKIEVKRRVRMPVGLDLGAQTPEEIAVSIMAEIIQHCQRDKQGSAKFRLK